MRFIKKELKSIALNRVCSINTNKKSPNDMFGLFLFD